MLNILPSRICFALLLAPQVPAGGKDFESGQHDDRWVVVVPDGEVIDHNYHAILGSIEISGIVNGDAYAAGASVLVDGQINGDLLGAGEKLPPP